MATMPTAMKVPMPRPPPVLVEAACEVEVAADLGLGSDSCWGARKQISMWFCV